MGVKRVLRRFADSTTLHGAPRIIRAKTWYMRVFWLALFLGASAMLVYQLAQLIRKFLAFEKRYTIDVIKHPAVFPWITMCTPRAFDIMTLEHTYAAFASSRKQRDVITQPFVRALTSFYDDVIVKAEGLSTNDQDSFTWNPYTLINMDQRLLAQSLTHFHDFEFESANMTQNWVRERLVFESDAVKKCFTYQFDYEVFYRLYGGTFYQPMWWMNIFDGGGLMHATMATKNRLKLPASIENMFGSSVDSRGIEVYIHAPNTDFSVFLNRLTKVIPGQYATIYMKPRGTIRLGQPYGNCSKTYPYKPRPTGPYEATTCYEVCLIHKINSACQCSAEELSQYTMEGTFANEEPCNSLGISPHAYANLSLSDLQAALVKVKAKIKCSNDVWNNVDVIAQCKEACPAACVKHGYDVDVTITEWPAQFAKRVRVMAGNYTGQLRQRNDTERLKLFRKHVSSGIKQASDTYKAESVLYETVSREFIGLRFILKAPDLTMPVTSEVPDYTIYQLLSDIGGQLGLWVGMSIITLLELTDLAFNVIKELCRKWKLTGSRRTSNSVTSPIKHSLSNEHAKDSLV